MKMIMKMKTKGVMNFGMCRVWLIVGYSSTFLPFDSLDFLVFF